MFVNASAYTTKNKLLVLSIFSIYINLLSSDLNSSKESILDIIYSMLFLSIGSASNKAPI